MGLRVIHVSKTNKYRCGCEETVLNHGYDGVPDLQYIVTRDCEDKPSLWRRILLRQRRCARPHCTCCGTDAFSDEEQRANELCWRCTSEPGCEHDGSKKRPSRPQITGLTGRKLSSCAECCHDPPGECRHDDVHVAKERCFWCGPGMQEHLARSEKSLKDLAQEVRNPPQPRSAKKKP